MREIKFRAWDSISLMMWDNRVVLETAPLSKFVKLEHYTLMQYTGLKDKNDVDIYEGDVVTWIDGDRQVVNFGIQGVDDFEGVGFNLWSHYGDKQDCTRLQSEIEVIGNIHQNPELIK